MQSEVTTGFHTDRLAAILSPGIYTFLAINIVDSPISPDRLVVDVDRGLSSGRLISEVVSHSLSVLALSNDKSRKIILAFSSTSLAVSSLVRYYAGHQEANGLELLSIGISIGEVSDGNGAECLAAQKASSLAELAPPGQVLLSTVAFETLRDTASSDCLFEDLGTVHLDLQLRRERIYQLSHAQLPTIRGRVNTEERERRPLPHRFGLLIGRDVALDDVYGRLRRFHAVTIVGVGGIGKSHLASRVAFEFQQDDDEDIVWVDLTGIQQADHVYGTLASALGLRAFGTIPLKQMLLRQLSNRRALIVLDGCDRCRSVVAEFIEQALSSQGPRFLITAARRLGISVESVVQLGPLELPQTVLPWLPEDLEDNDSTGLFMDRAREVDPSFEVSDDEASAVARICSRLGGHPLSIVLAAKRARRRSPSQILFELRAIETGRPDAAVETSVPKRHRNLVEAFQWSFESLSVEAQKLVKSLFPLRGRWRKEDAAAMADVDRNDVQDPLMELVDAGFVSLEKSNETGDLFRLPTHVSTLIEKHFVSPKEREAILEQHCLITVGKLGVAARNLSGEDDVKSLNLIDDFRADLAAAFEFTLRPSGQLKTFVEGITRSWSYWYKRNHIEDGLRLIDRALKRFSDRESQDIVKILNLGGILATKAGQTDTAFKYLRKALAIVKRQRLVQMQGIILANIGSAYWSVGENHMAIRYYEEAEPFVVSKGEARGLYALYMSWTTALLDHEDPTLAELVLQKAIENITGNFDHLCSWAKAISLGTLDLRRGNKLRACQHFVEAVRLAEEMSDFASLARSLVWVAEVELSFGNFELSGKLLGAAHFAGHKSGIQLYRVNELRIARLEGQCRVALGDSRFSESRFNGALMNLNDLLDSVSIG